MEKSCQTYRSLADVQCSCHPVVRPPSTSTRSNSKSCPPNLAAPSLTMKRRNPRQIFNSNVGAHLHCRLQLPTTLTRLCTAPNTTTEWHRKASTRQLDVRQHSNAMQDTQTRATAWPGRVLLRLWTARGNTDNQQRRRDTHTTNHTCSSWLSSRVRVRGKWISQARIIRPPFHPTQLDPIT